MLQTANKYCATRPSQPRFFISISELRISGLHILIVIRFVSTGNPHWHSTS